MIRRLISANWFEGLSVARQHFQTACREIPDCNLVQSYELIQQENNFNNFNRGGDKDANCYLSNCSQETKRRFFLKAVRRDLLVCLLQGSGGPNGRS